MTLKQINRGAKRERKFLLQKTKDRNQRRLIHRIKIGQVYKYTSQVYNTVLLIAKGFGSKKVFFESIAMDIGLSTRMHTFRFSYEEFDILSPVSIEELPLYLDLNHSNLFEEIFLEA